jgi:tRNA(adenine34) deaminase
LHPLTRAAPARRAGSLAGGQFRPAAPIWSAHAGPVAGCATMWAMEQPATDPLAAAPESTEPLAAAALLADHARFMREAMAEAALAESHGDVPIGAVVVAGGEIVGRGRNERELASDPTAHAEVLALREAAHAIGDGWRVSGATLYVTLEPCTMCAGAIVLARVPRVVFGAYDPKAGACGSVLSVLDRPELNHRPEVVGGVLEPECAELLRAFFRSRR